MDKKFFWESWRLANRSSEYIRWALTGAVTVYFVHHDHALMNSWCFGIDIVLTSIGCVIVLISVAIQHKMFELDEQYYAKGVEREQKKKHWDIISREMSDIETKNGNNLKILKRLLFSVYIIAGISVIMAPICTRCFS